MATEVRNTNYHCSLWMLYDVNRFKCQEEPHTLSKLLNAIKWSSHKDVSQVCIQCCICLCVCVCICVCMCVHMTVCRSVYLSICLFVWPSVHLSLWVCVAICVIPAFSVVLLYIFCTYAHTYSYTSGLKGKC